MMIDLDFADLVSADDRQQALLVLFEPELELEPIEFGCVIAMNR